MAATVNLELDPIFLKALGFLHSKSKDSAEKLKALLDESLARGTDSSYRPSQKVLSFVEHAGHFTCVVITPAIPVLSFLDEGLKEVEINEQICGVTMLIAHL